MVGSALACALAANPLTQSLKVALLESSPPSTKPLRALPGIRVSAITPTNAAFFDCKFDYDYSYIILLFFSSPSHPLWRILSIDLLFTAIGAWQEMKNARVTPYHDMKIWHHFNRGQVHWRAKDVGREDLGYIVENDVIQTSLFKRLADLSQDKDCEAAEVVAPVKVVAIQPSSPTTNDSPPIIVLSNGQSVTTRLLVGADGGNSSVKNYARIGSLGTDYNQKYFFLLTHNGLVLN
jgi:2-polyprenyl-6-methoxyphenol hydroxylase-like FAD-dependent oxidoreductase